jgi:hypothetical protein
MDQKPLNDAMKDGTGSGRQAEREKISIIAPTIRA